MNDKIVVGRSVLRREDRRFLTGTGQFTDDTQAPEALHAFVLRSPHAHANILGIDTARALHSSGVVGVFLAADLEAAGVAAIPCQTQVPPMAVRNRDGSLVPLADQYALARGKVRYVGEPVAFIVAQSFSQACDAAELVEVDYEPLVAVMTARQAESRDAASVWDHVPSNISLNWAAGDIDDVQAVFDNAAHVTRLQLDYPRVVVAFMEPRAIVVRHESASNATTIWAGTQAPHRNRDMIADLLDVPVGKIHVITPDMGGGFGARGGLYPEYLLSVFAARQLGCTVRWTGTRAESFLSDTQARDLSMQSELALDRDGRFTALRVRAVYRHGAYIPGRSLWALLPHMAEMLCGAYQIPKACLEIKGVFSNTAPVSPLRGVARAEANYSLERLVATAARELNRDPVELRRLNVISSDQMPWRTTTGAHYDSGDFGGNLELTLEKAQADTFDTRRAESEAKGRLRGLGIGLYVESTMGAPNEFAEVIVEPDGPITVHMGTQNFGMGHETIFAQILADELELDHENIFVDCGDTARVKTGSGSHGSRSTRIGGTALVLAGRKLVKLARSKAAEFLEVSQADVEYANGRFTIPGTDRGADLVTLARQEHEHGRTLSGHAHHEVSAPVYPNGCHVCEVEVDPDTGSVQIVAHAMVADTGRAINPMLVHGQLQGGLAQGLGHVMGECADYDPDTGQLRSGSFLDYFMPRADDFPMFSTHLNDVPTADNPLGVKGAGEGPTTGSPAAMLNAIVDALSPYGITHLDMPVTSERVWCAIRGRLAATSPGTGA